MQWNFTAAIDDDDNNNVKFDLNEIRLFVRRGGGAGERTTKLNWQKRI